MTFSQSVKSEIYKTVRNLKGDNATFFLTAVLKSIGSLTLGNNGFAFSIESDNTDFLSLCKNLAFSQLGVEAEIESYNVNAKGQAVYSCTFDGRIGEMLRLTTRDNDGALTVCDDASSLVPQEPNCLRAFMQGLFLACGSVVIPVVDGSEQWQNKLNSKYHLELRFTDAVFAEAVSSAFPSMEFHSTSRKNHLILYLKDSEKIADFFVFVNAMKAKLDLENVIIGRSMRNTANRQMNCITANIEKTVAASARQLAAIEVIRKTGLFEGLPDQLKDIALLREQYPEANLDEIANMLNISKSGANHRFAKLIELANI